MSSSNSIRVDLINKKLPQLDKILSSSTTYSAMEMLALTMVDFDNKNLHIKLSFDDVFLCRVYSEHCLHTVLNCKQNYCLLRSVRRNNTFLNQFMEYSGLKSDTALPVSLEQYMGHKIILDVNYQSNLNGEYYDFLFYKWGEHSARRLELRHEKKIEKVDGLEDLIDLDQMEK